MKDPRVARWLAEELEMIDNKPTGHMDSSESEGSDVENVLINEDIDTYFFNNDHHHLPII